MENNHKISSHQFMSVIFLSIVLLPFAASRAMLADKSGINISFSFLLCALFIVIFSRFVDCSYEKITESKTLCFSYLLYFLFIGVYNLSLFLVFISNVISPNIKISFIALAVCAVSLYASFKGIETIGRSCVITVFIIFVAVLILIFASGFEFKAENIKINEFSFKEIFNGSLDFFSRTFIMPAFLFLNSFSSLKRKKHIVLWSAVSFFILFILSLFCVGRLGSYFNTQLFPIYRLSEIVSVGPFSKGEIFFLGAFLMGVIMEISAVIFISLRCVSKISIQENKKRYYIFFSVLIAVFSILVSSSVKIQHYVFSGRILLMLSLIFSIGIPIFINIKNKKVIGVFLSLMLLTGCSESKIQDKMMVSGMYLEKENEKFVVSLIASHSKENEYYEGKGESVKEAISVLEDECGKKAVFSREMLVFLGENIANEKTNEILDFFIRYYEILPSSKMIYSKASKEEFEKNTNEIIKETSALIKNNNVKKTDIVEFINAFLDKNGDFSLPVFEKENDKYNISKIAVFKNSEIHRILDEKTSKDYLLYLGEIKEDTVIIDSEIFGKVTLFLTNIKTKNDDNSIIIFANADISECEKFENKLFDYKQYELFENELSKVLRKKIQAVLKSTACDEKNIIINANVNKMEEEANPIF